MRLRVHSTFSLLYILSIIFNGRTSSQSQMADSKFLNVGEELLRETLPLQMGLRLYQLQGLKPYTWYEVKISYPASIPASFSLQLKRGKSNSVLNHYRRLLNTEKLIFRTESLESLSNEDGIYVLVTVEPEGIVAIPHVQERLFIIFNIGKRSCMKRCSDGHWISKSVIQMDQEKIKSVMGWEVPKKERAGSSSPTWLGRPAL
ncbi:uncharacterized protein LOC122316074 isoform X2 [Carya illinoinensis]|uniref:uncharacterized protein LOC122316074 isoform X2 n=1 Tax=Carya illinoinensis TaxID=32201 RepID=UPI001C723C80|nr:uncharacterized protein LOC122316074 isoform X2 [Carya illinoinensis]